MGYIAAASSDPDANISAVIKANNTNESEVFVHTVMNYYM